MISPLDVADSVPTNNSATDTDNVLATQPIPTNFSVKLSATPNKAPPGTTVILFAQLFGGGSGGEAKLELTPALGLTMRTAPQGCVQSGATWTCATETLSGGAVRYYSFVAAIDAAAGATMQSGVRAILAAPDVNALDDEAYASVEVTGAAVVTDMVPAEDESDDQKTDGATGGCHCGASDDDSDALAWCLLLLSLSRRFRPLSA